MNRFCFILLLLFVLCSCQEKGSSKAGNIITIQTKNNIRHARNSFSKPGLKVTAYLLYNNGTLSSFDILNDKTIALWNVVAGGGDAAKPSENTKIIFTGSPDSVNIKIENGKTLPVDTMIIHSDKSIDFIIKDTGCQPVYISILKRKQIIYKDTIAFHCGE